MKKLKDITVKQNPAPSAKPLGVNPSDPWSTKAGITEGALEQYLMSKGINPNYISTQMKISHAKSTAFLKWKQNHTESVEINEGSLEQYLMSKGINHNSISSDQKISHAKSSAFKKWQADRKFEEVENVDESGRCWTGYKPVPGKKAFSPGSCAKEEKGSQTTQLTPEEVEMDEMTTMSLGSLSRGTTFNKGDTAHHPLAGHVKVGRTDKHSGLTHVTGVRDNKTYQVRMHTLRSRPIGEDADPVKKVKTTALDKFRAGSTERAKKHADIEKSQSKDGSGMSSAIDRLAKHMKEEAELEEAKHYPYKFRATYHDPDTNKMTHVMDFSHRNLEAAKKHAEGSRLQRKDGKEDKLHSVVQMKEEHLDELKKSTMASYKDKSSASLKNAQANRDAAEPGKHMSKGFADLHAKSDAIAKKRVKGLIGYMQRKQGMKPTSEDVGDAKAADPSVGSCNCGPDPVSEKKKQMTKSARMIKSLYKKKGVVKEDMFDSEKEDKSVATYGKKPKMTTTSKMSNLGEKKPEAAAVMTGGTTLTGQKRDTLEIDPALRNRPGQPNVDKQSNKSR